MLSRIEQLFVCTTIQFFLNYTFFSLFGSDSRRFIFRITDGDRIAIVAIWYLFCFSIGCIDAVVGGFALIPNCKKNRGCEMNKFMVVHHNPGIDCNVVQANWRKLAKVENAQWLRTYFNEKEGWRYCVWLAPDERELEKIFNEIEVSYESILQVEETVPDLWGEAWDLHLKSEEVADTLGN